jgi:hypothetical protein
MKLTDVEHRVVDIDSTRAHAYNQVNVRRMKSGGLVAVYNEERFAYHHDSGQTVMLRSRDDGETWVDRTVVLPYTAETGNWEGGICEIDRLESEIFEHARSREFGVDSLAQLPESVLARWPRGPHAGAI